ncbi:MAG: hypothetical protein HY940_01560 [Gammaproteobacteria bacterium]|nr:hypothetical protein [Gammaproteobacteria bacterium]
MVRVCNLRTIQVIVAGLLSLLLVMLAGCGDTRQALAPGSDDTVVRAVQRINVAGMIYAPPTQLAALGRPSWSARMLQLIIPDSVAAVTGLNPVLNATVELQQLNSQGQLAAVIASYTTSDGTFSFPDTIPGSTFIVTVAGQATTMRAFVTGATVDITPQSEAVVAAVLGGLPGSGRLLENYTVAELQALLGVVNDRNVDVSALTFAQAVAALSTDSTAIVTSLVSGYGAAGAAVISSSDLDLFALNEHSIHLADPAGAPAAITTQTGQGTGYGSLARGSLAGVLSLPEHNQINGGILTQGDSRATAVLKASQIEDNATTSAELTQLQNTACGPGYPCAANSNWANEVDHPLLTPAANGQVVVQAEDGTTVVGFMTRDGQLLVYPVEQTIGTTQHVRGVRLLTKKWDTNACTTNCSVQTFSYGVSNAKLSGSYSMIEYLQMYGGANYGSYNIPDYHLLTSSTSQMNFDGQAVAGRLNDPASSALTGMVSVGAFPGAAIPFRMLSVKPVAGGALFQVSKTTGTYPYFSGIYSLAGADAAHGTGLYYYYAVHKTGEVELWDGSRQFHYGVGGMTADGEVVVVPPTNYYASNPKIRGLNVYGKRSAANTGLTAAALAGTYNVVAHGSFVSDGATVNSTASYRYGSVTLNANGTVGAGELLYNGATMNFTNMKTTTPPGVSAAPPSRQLISGGSWTVSNGVITVTLNLADSAGTALPTLSGDGFAAKQGDFIALQMNSDLTATSGERGAFFLGRQY